MKTSVLFGMIVWFFIGCGPLSMGVGLTEVSRFTSPDSRVDAVIFTSDAGATTSVGYHIFIVQKDAQPEDLKAAIFTADHVDDLKVFWQQSKHLKITYQTAMIYKFTNFWQSKYVDNFRYKVKITETEIGA